MKGVLSNAPAPPSGHGAVCLADVGQAVGGQTCISTERNGIWTLCIDCAESRHQISIRNYDSSKDEPGDIAHGGRLDHSLDHDGDNTVIVGCRKTSLSVHGAQL